MCMCVSVCGLWAWLNTASEVSYIYTWGLENWIWGVPRAYMWLPFTLRLVGENELWDFNRSFIPCILVIIGNKISSKKGIAF